MPGTARLYSGDLENRFSTVSNEIFIPRASKYSSLSFALFKSCDLAQIRSNGTIEGLTKKKLGNITDCEDMLSQVNRSERTCIPSDI